MKKFIVALILSLAIVFPTGTANAGTCLNLVVSTCVSTPLDPVTDPLLNGLVSPRQPPVVNPPTVPTQPQNPSTGGSNNNGGTSSQNNNSNNDIQNPSQPRRNVPTPVRTTVPSQTDDSRVVYVPVPVTEEVTITEFKNYPWYVWVTFLVAALLLGFLFFYDTEPKLPKNRLTSSK